MGSPPSSSGTWNRKVGAWFRFGSVLVPPRIRSYLPLEVACVLVYVGNLDRANGNGRLAENDDLSRVRVLESGTISHCGTHSGSGPGSGYPYLSALVGGGESEDAGMGTGRIRQHELGLVVLVCDLNGVRLVPGSWFFVPGSSSSWYSLGSWGRRGPCP